MIDATVIEWNKPKTYELGIAITVLSYAVLLMVFVGAYITRFSNNLKQFILSSSARTRWKDAA